ncbi:MAG: DUF418 domain-containing protein [Acidobacteriales bacterium]|nr:DUF418 domain-containing protein [Terriglobales bacterium]
MSALAVKPVAPGERIELLDVLRGFALFGVLAANLVWVATDFAVTPEQMAKLSTAKWDTAATYFNRFFIEWKFYTLFSFLFGLGFAVQMSRVAERGGEAQRTYLRRLVVLLGIGILHNTFLWYGDILHTYALLGLLLLASRNLSTKKLLIISFALIVVSQTAVVAWPQLKQMVVPVAKQASEAHPQPSVETHRYEIFTYGTYGDVVKEHLHDYFTDYLTSGFFFLFLMAIFGKFLLGFLVGRYRILHAPERHLASLRTVMFWGLGIGLLGNVVFVWHLWAERNHFFERSDAPIFSTLWIADLGMVAMTAFYVCAITLLFQKPVWRKRLSVLAPVGRMALTNYLSHSLVYAVLFYGYGIGLALLGRIGAAACLLLAVVVFSVQILLSRWWLSRYAFGPMEWLWRSLTYGKAQPMSLRPKGMSASA